MYGKLTCGLVLLCCFAGSMATGDIVTVCKSGCDYSTLMEAIAASQDGDVIQLEAEVFREPIGVSNAGKSLTIRGRRSAGGSILTSLNVTGVYSGYGSGLQVAGGELVVEDLRVYTIGTNVNQSAVVLSGGSAILRRCVIGSGSPVAGGQGVASSLGTFLDIQDCEFLYCKDIYGYQRRGGGLRIGGDAVVSSSVFIGCESNFTGGAIYCGSGSLAISGSSFMSNYAPMGSVVYGTGFSFEQSAACGTSNWFGGSGWVDLGGNCFVADCQDCNENDRADLCDILMGVELDINFDSIPDGCQCVTDLNEDGSTDAGDVGVLLAFWGPVAAFPAADINSDGRVDSADLGLVLGYLGDCR